VSQVFQLVEMKSAPGSRGSGQRNQWQRGVRRAWLRTATGVAFGRYWGTWRGSCDSSASFTVDWSPYWPDPSNTLAVSKQAGESQTATIAKTLTRPTVQAAFTATALLERNTKDDRL